MKILHILEIDMHIYLQCNLISRIISAFMILVVAGAKLKILGIGVRCCNSCSPGPRSVQKDMTIIHWCF
jgi:hypothetical protein